MGSGQIPLITKVAFRGLWDRFAAPGSLGAVRRAIIKKSPTIVRIPFEISLQEFAVLVSEVRPEKVYAPIFVEYDDSLDYSVLQSMAADLPLPIFSFPAQPQASPRIISHIVSKERSAPIGIYIPLAATMETSFSWEKFCSGLTTDIIVFESSDTVLNLAEQKRIAHPGDDVIEERIRATINHARIIKASDLVELDILLSQPPRV